ncbi:hypothetical protein KKI24_05760 [bacterium]|nr:hypothetical protein [bacterium]
MNFMLIIVVAILLLTSSAFAQQPPPAAPGPAQPGQAEQAAAPAAGGTPGNSGIGINGVISHTPQENDLSDVGGKEDIDKLDIYFDWEWLRVGFNMTNAGLEFAAYNINWETRLKKNTTYVAYRLSSADTQSTWDLFVLAGLAYTEASFKITNTSSHTSADLGYLAGGGVFYIMGNLSLGLEWMQISTQGNFDGLKIATGSTQVLSGFRYSF